MDLFYNSAENEKRMLIKNSICYCFLQTKGL